MTIIQYKILKGENSGKKQFTPKIVDNILANAQKTIIMCKHFTGQLGSWSTPVVHD